MTISTKIYNIPNIIHLRFRRELDISHIIRIHIYTPARL